MLNSVRGAGGRTESGAGSVTTAFPLGVPSARAWADAGNAPRTRARAAASGATPALGNNARVTLGVNKSAKEFSASVPILRSPNSCKFAQTGL